MAAATSSPVDVSAQLPSDVYQEHFDFIDAVRDIVASIDGQTPDGVVRAQVELILALVGRDLLKLHRLVEVVNARIVSRSSWAIAIGVKFYRALFTAIDPNLELDVFNVKRTTGADIAGVYILEVARQFTAKSEWAPGSVNVLEFSLCLLRASSIGQRGLVIAKKLGCGLLEKMATSPYLPFYNNYDNFSTFAYKVIPLLDTTDANSKSSRVSDILQALKEAEYERTNEDKAELELMCHEMGRSDLYQKHTEDTVVEHIDSPEFDYVYSQGRFSLVPLQKLDQEIKTSWKLFTTTPAWELPAIERLLKSISEAMKIDAPTWVQTVTLDMIEVIMQSEHLFLNQNLQILVGFIRSVAPALDDMADTHQCGRLTALLHDLSIHSCVQSVQDRDAIEVLRRDLGRIVRRPTTQPAGDGLQEDELSGAVSKLDID
ncbi:hypothetical protein J4E93_009025 [Alternaria ventricosa]|uniref:uncharacterized protein n=1 Tax=Alternaria ventricosa TaxID=1187951 RepID=UPI0020C1C1F6|nr:uncharacterized protein J4E93_009025 [Alternaria ventricosa]KAI4639671.1 hypothetical protein J4E93_009025 [Alternaria ventricosa]